MVVPPRCITPLPQSLAMSVVQQLSPPVAGEDRLLPVIDVDLPLRPPGARRLVPLWLPPSEKRMEWVAAVRSPDLPWTWADPPSPLPASVRP
ncbi:hypothetical protein ACLOJK_026810 [Asimina triloba]